jgi:hypothetical protein
LAGRVVDAQLAATPGASVTVRSLSTSTTWMATSDDGGRFTFAMLPPGEYGVEISLSGFVTWRAEAVTLQVGQERQLDVQLLIGNVEPMLPVASVVCSCSSSRRRRGSLTASTRSTSESRGRSPSAGRFASNRQRD